MKIKNVYRDKETLYLKLSRDVFVYSVICVLFTVIAVKDVIPCRRCFPETKIKRKNKRFL